MSLFHLLFGFSGRIEPGQVLACGRALACLLGDCPAGLSAGGLLHSRHCTCRTVSCRAACELTRELVQPDPGLSVVLLIIFIDIWCVSWISAFAIGIKRLHDRNKNGWLIVLFYVAPSILAGIANTSEQAVVSFVLGLGSFVISIWAPGGAWIPARDRRPQPVWPRSAATAAVATLLLRQHLPVPELRIGVVGTVPAGTDRLTRPPISNATSAIRARRDCEISARVCPAPRRSRHSPCCRCR